MGGVIKSLAKPFKIMDTISNPLGAVISNNVSKKNVLRQVIDPTGIARQNYAEQGKITFKNATDPGSVFTQSDEQIAAQQAELDAAKAQASAPTIDSGFLSAQQQSDRLRRRRGVLGNIFAGASSLG
jgi:hypothetical protein